MEEIALPKLTKAHAPVSGHPELVGRAFLQFLHHNHTPSPLAGLRSAPLRAQIARSS
jgi:hypothetical protein